MGLTFLLLLFACAAGEASPPAGDAAPEASAAVRTGEAAGMARAREAPDRADPFEAWLRVDGPVATSFAPTPGPGWGERDGRWVADAPTEVRAPAAGRVLTVAPGRIVLRHVAFENADRVERTLEILGVDAPTVAAGDDVARGAALGRATEVAVRVGGDGPPSLAGLAGLRLLPDPAAEAVLAIVDHGTYSMRVYHRGVEVRRGAISFGQAAGAKQQRGDNRSPVGAYHVVAKSQGPFTGPAAAYYGGHWIKLNYPNPWDAARGVERGWIDPTIARGIASAWDKRGLTAQDTRLGGGIGLHGWAYEWPDDGPRHLSWGCVVMHLRDVAEVYAALPVGALVVLIEGDERAGAG